MSRRRASTIYWHTKKTRCWSKHVWPRRYINHTSLNSGATFRWPVSAMLSHGEFSFSNFVNTRSRWRDKHEKCQFMFSADRLFIVAGHSMPINLPESLSWSVGSSFASVTNDTDVLPLSVVNDPKSTINHERTFARKHREMDLRNHIALWTAFLLFQSPFWLILLSKSTKERYTSTCTTLYCYSRICSWASVRGPSWM